jgi:hypothetical protein
MAEVNREYQLGLRSLAPPPRRRRAVRFDEKTWKVTFAGQIYPISNPRVFHVYRAIVGAAGRTVSSEELHRLPGCKGARIDRLLKKLPQGLRDTIASMAMPGGGYFFRLP